jgi:hypothetical protein
MDHTQLENFTLEELRKEARKYQLTASADRNALIDAIMTHFEQNSPAEDFRILGRTRHDTRQRIGSGQSEASANEQASMIRTVDDPSPS